MMSAIKSVTPVIAKQMMDDGALLIDIRQPEEFAREHIDRAQLHPLSMLTAGSERLVFTASSKIIFHCLSGMRSTQNAALLASAVAPAQVYLLAGGLNAWKKAGLPVQISHQQPLDIMRQVQIAAGSLVVIGVILGYSANIGFFVLSGLVGVGLIFAGVSGYCGLARLLLTMPWNNKTAR
jgi:rhodanese-related sulfurtransferase